MPQNVTAARPDCAYGGAMIAVSDAVIVVEIANGLPEDCCNNDEMISRGKAQCYIGSVPTLLLPRKHTAARGWLSI